MNWQERNPGVCCGCGTKFSIWTPDNPPICVECYDIINGEDD